MFRFKSCSIAASAALLCTITSAHAALITSTFNGSISSWVDNPMGITNDTSVSLSIAYDSSWITPKINYDGQQYNVINIIDYYDQGGRLTLNIDGAAYNEMSSENPVPTSDPYVDGWYNSIPYILFDDSGAPIGFSSQWLDYSSDLVCNPYCNSSWESDIYANNSNAVSIWFIDHINGDTQGYIHANIDFTPVPLPPSMLLFSSALVWIVGLARKKAVA